jgi:hypothetical protein
MKIRSLTKNILQVTSVEAENAALIDTRARAFQSEEIDFPTTDKKKHFNSKDTINNRIKDGLIIIVLFERAHIAPILSS